MKYFLLLALTFAGQVASADPIRNINGVDGRLERLFCFSGGGYVANKSNMTKIDQRAEKECTSGTEQEKEACFREVVKKSADLVNVIFNGSAIAGQKEFKMIIGDGNSNREYFHSIREGFHGDSPEGITLMFNRAGVQDDEFMIYTGLLSEDGNSTPMVMVPVKRRLLADQVYFFFDCKLVWQN